MFYDKMIISSTQERSIDNENRRILKKIQRFSLYCETLHKSGTADTGKERIPVQIHRHRLPRHGHHLLHECSCTVKKQATENNR